MSVHTDAPAPVDSPAGTIAAPIHRIGRDDLLAIGQDRAARAAWAFVPLALRWLSKASDDWAVRLLLATRYAHLGLRLAAREQLAVLPDQVRAEPSLQALADLLERLPPDEITVTDSTRVCRANVEALRKRGIDLSSDVKTWSQRRGAEEWFCASDGNIARRARVDPLSGHGACGTWRHFRDDKGEANGFALAEEGASGASASKPVEPRVVEGLDPPWLFLKVFKESTPRGDGYSRPISVVQADVLEFLDGLSQADMRGAIADERVRFFIGPEAPHKLAADLDARLDTRLPGSVVSLGMIGTPAAPSVLSILQAATKKQRELDDELLNRVRRIYAGRDAAWWQARYARNEAGWLSRWQWNRG